MIFMILEVLITTFQVSQRKGSPLDEERLECILGIVFSIQALK